MQFFTTLFFLTGAAVTMASPTPVAAPVTPVRRNAMINTRQEPLCSGLTGTAECCAVDVLGLADLQCATHIPDFIAICASIGQEARCCAIPILDQALICGAPL